MMLRSMKSYHRQRESKTEDETLTLGYIHRDQQSQELNDILSNVDDSLFSPAGNLRNVRGRHV